MKMEWHELQTGRHQANHEIHVDETNNITVYAKWLPFEDLTITRNGVTFTIMDRNL